MKLRDIVESVVSPIGSIYKNAEKAAFDASSESKNSVSGDAILKHAMRRINNLGLTGQDKKDAVKQVTDQIAKDY